jgi:hypothetical protein
VLCGVSRFVSFLARAVGLRQVQQLYMQRVDGDSSVAGNVFSEFFFILYWVQLVLGAASCCY